MRWSVVRARSEVPQADEHVGEDGGLWSVEFFGLRPWLRDGSNVVRESGQHLRVLGRDAEHPVLVLSAAGHHLTVTGVRVDPVEGVPARHDLIEDSKGDDRIDAIPLR